MIVFFWRWRSVNWCQGVQEPESEKQQSETSWLVGRHSTCGWRLARKRMSADVK